ncbi:hypothetical protein KHHGKMAE_1927 [Methylobacterium persicinum]|nr:hypothetical protein KHHGKMAE_1927 [Methylobacterium persicinum]
MWRTGIYNHDGPENVNSTIGWVCFLLIFGYVGFNVFSPNNDINIGLDTIIGVLGIYVVFKYLRRSVITILTGSGDSSDFLIVGVLLSWLSQSGRAAGSIVTRLSGFDPAWLNSEYFGIVKVVTILAAVCHVVPAGAIKANGRESVPAPSRFGLAAAFLLSFVMIFALLTYKPNLKPWIDSMPGWSKDMFQTGANKDRQHHAIAEPPH